MMALSTSGSVLKIKMGSHCYDFWSWLKCLYSGVLLLCYLIGETCVWFIVQNIRLVVDECENAKIIENENDQTSYEDRRACEATSETPGDDIYLSVTTPLQLGGRTVVNIPFPTNVPQDGFNGCIKNLIHNGKASSVYFTSVSKCL